MNFYPSIPNILFQTVTLSINSKHSCNERDSVFLFDSSYDLVNLENITIYCVTWIMKRTFLSRKK